MGIFKITMCDNTYTRKYKTMKIQPNPEWLSDYIQVQIEPLPIHITKKTIKKNGLSMTSRSIRDAIWRQKCWKLTN